MSDKLGLAKSLFAYHQMPVKQIAEVTGIPEYELHAHIYGEDGHGADPLSWISQQRSGALITEEQYELMSPLIMAHTKAHAQRIAAQVLERIDGDEATIDDASKAVDILTKIDKIDRLDKGKATSITGVDLDRMDAKDIIAERRNRSDYIEAEYTEKE